MNSARRGLSTTKSTVSWEPTTPLSSIDVELDLRDGTTRRQRFRRWLSQELASPGVYVLPLRLFIGVGWMRAATEKMTDPAWYNGSAVRSFLDGQLEAGVVAFQAYEWLSEHLWHPTAMPLGWLVLLGQLVIGTAIFLGVFSNAALLVGIFLNMNFMFAGAISPSAFYIIIQIALLAMGAGAVFGLDHRWRNSSRSVLLIARRDGLTSEGRDRWWIAGLAIAFVGTAVAAGRVSDFAKGVEDPAAVLFAVMLVCSTTLGISVARDLVRHRPAVAIPSASEEGVSGSGQASPPG